MVVSNSGSDVWVTARESDEVLGFSTLDLLANPANALVASVQVGEAPVGVAVVDAGQLLVVANSNRFSNSSASASLSVVNIADALAGKSATARADSLGAFPTAARR